MSLPPGGPPAIPRKLKGLALSAQLSPGCVSCAHLRSCGPSESGALETGFGSPTRLPPIGRGELFSEGLRSGLCRDLGWVPAGPRGGRSARPLLRPPGFQSRDSGSLRKGRRRSNVAFPTLQQSPEERDGGAALVEFVVWGGCLVPRVRAWPGYGPVREPRELCAPCGHFPAGLGIRLSDSNLSAEASSPIFTRKLPPFKCRQVIFFFP